MAERHILDDLTNGIAPQHSSVEDKKSSGKSDPIVIRHDLPFKQMYLFAFTVLVFFSTIVMYFYTFYQDKMYKLML